MASGPSTPIETFVEVAMGTREVQNATAGWRLEPMELVKLLVRHFREMGIYFVQRTHEKLVLKHVMHQLKFSPEILSRLRALEDQEDMRRKTRHAE